MFKFFKKNDSTKIEQKKNAFEIDLISSVLAYEIARSDGDIDQVELSRLLEEIKKISIKVGKSEEDILNLIEIYSNDSVSFYEFIEDININFIKGDLNLIGPRPGLPSQAELMKFRLASGIFDITPGITGLAQVLGYDMSNPEKLAKIDKLYINNKKSKLDLIIFFATFFKSLRKRLSMIFLEEINEIESEKYNV